MNEISYETSRFTGVKNESRTATLPAAIASTKENGPRDPKVGGPFAFSERC
jgi:hypothetical protein